MRRLNAADPLAASKFAETVRDHFARRLPATPLAVQLETPPGDFDTGVWLALDKVDIDRQIHREERATAFSRTEVNDLVSRQVLVPWDKTLAPFHVTILDRLEPEVADVAMSGSLVGLVLQTHHSVADGVGFQSIIEDLTDSVASPTPADAPASLTSDPGDTGYDCWRFNGASL